MVWWSRESGTDFQKLNRCSSQADSRTKLHGEEAQGIYTRKQALTLLLTLEKIRQEECSEFKACLGHSVMVLLKTTEHQKLGVRHLSDRREVQGLTLVLSK